MTTADRHPQHVARTLGIEIGLLLAPRSSAATADVQPSTFSGDAVIAMLALAMGVRNATVRRLAVPDLTTTVLTMTLTGLAADSRLAGGSGKGSVRRIAAVLAMLAGALAGALLLKISLVPPLLAAAASRSSWRWRTCRSRAGRRDAFRRRGVAQRLPCHAAHLQPDRVLGPVLDHHNPGAAHHLARPFDRLTTATFQSTKSLSVAVPRNERDTTGLGQDLPGGWTQLSPGRAR